jgi:ADP-ribose pyrophosphatase
MEGTPMTHEQHPADTRILHAGSHLRFLEQDGWEYVSRTSARNVVGVIALTDAGELVLVEQYRTPTGCRVIELPAGLIGDQGAETDLEAAARELEEETGFQADRLERLWTGPSSSGLTDELVVLVRAYGLRRVHDGGGVDEERITVHLVPLGQLDSWLEDRESSGLLVDLKVRLARHALEMTS